MNDFCSLPPAERFARIAHGVQRALVMQGFGSVLGQALLVLVGTRLRVAASHVVALAARLQAGTLRLRPPRERVTPSCQAEPPQADAASSARLRLPRGFAWLLHRVRGIVFGRSQLTHLLHQPDMAELIAAAPPVAHHLRPICRMLGVKPPPGLFPPRRRRQPIREAAAPAARSRKPARRPAPAASPSIFPPRPRHAAPPRKPPAPAANGPPQPS